MYTYTDGFTAKSFIKGNNYTKNVTNLSDPAFHKNCVHVGRYITFLLRRRFNTTSSGEELQCC